MDSRAARPQWDARLQEIEELLRATAKNGAEAERRFNRRMDRAEACAKLADERRERRAKLANARMDKFDKRPWATQESGEAWLKLMVRMNRRLDALIKKLDEIAKTQRLILRLVQGGSNGHGRLGSH